MDAVFRAFQARRKRLNGFFSFFGRSARISVVAAVAMSAGVGTASAASCSVQAGWSTPILVYCLANSFNGACISALFANNDIGSTCCTQPSPNGGTQEACITSFCTAPEPNYSDELAGPSNAIGITCP